MSKETGRVTVSTYVPEYQREVWKADASNLDMSQSEFVRTMVQAGRRGFDLTDESGEPPEGDNTDVDPRGNDLKKGVQAVLCDVGPLEWNEIVKILNEDFEQQLVEAVEELEDEGRIEHSGPRGGYFLTGGKHGE